jgi:predicted nuclease of predicted toxin-antitoxin system
MARAQHQVIAPAGGYKDTTMGSLSWTLGEPVIVTLVATDNILTQGFQQGSFTVSEMIVSKDLDFAITVFPNPSTDYVVLKVDNSKSKSLSYFLSNVDGKILSTDKLISSEQQISLSNCAKGTYLLSVQNENGQVLKSFKIIKK